MIVSIRENKLIALCIRHLLSSHLLQGTVLSNLTLVDDDTYLMKCILTPLSLKIIVNVVHVVKMQFFTFVNHLLIYVL